VAAMTLVSGNPAQAHGLNIEGMRRKDWSKETINTLRTAYKLIFKSGKTTEEVIEELTQDFLPQEPKVQLLIDSLLSSKRGIIR
jgi:UDP-N-acetylglucosamine acyltransferase